MNQKHPISDFGQSLKWDDFWKPLWIKNIPFQTLGKFGQSLKWDDFWKSLLWDPHTLCTPRCPPCAPDIPLIATLTSIIKRQTLYSIHWVRTIGLPNSYGACLRLLLTPLKSIDWGEWIVRVSDSETNQEYKDEGQHKHLQVKQKLENS